MHRFQITVHDFIVMSELKKDRVRKTFHINYDEAIHWKIYFWALEYNVTFHVKGISESVQIACLNGSIIRQTKKGVGKIMKRTLSNPLIMTPSFYLYIAETSMAVHYRLLFT